MTHYNRIDSENLPFIDLIPNDDQNDERETLQTGSEEAPYGGATWNTIPRDAIAQIHAIFSPVEQTAMPHVCLRVMLQKVHDEAGQFIQQPEHDASYSKQSPHINYQIQQSLGKVHQDKVSVFHIREKEGEQDFLLLQTKANAEGHALASHCALLNTLEPNKQMSPFLHHNESIKFKEKIYIVLEHLTNAVSLSFEISAIYSN